MKRVIGLVVAIASLFILINGSVTGAATGTSYQANSFFILAIIGFLFSFLLIESGTLEEKAEDTEPAHKGVAHYAGRAAYGTARTGYRAGRAVARGAYNTVRAPAYAVGATSLETFNGFLKELFSGPGRYEGKRKARKYRQLAGVNESWWQELWTDKKYADKLDEAEKLILALSYLYQEKFDLKKAVKRIKQISNAASPENPIYKEAKRLFKKEKAEQDKQQAEQEKPYVEQEVNSAQEALRSHKAEDYRRFTNKGLDEEIRKANAKKRK